jgi:hypothetical protein
MAGNDYNVDADTLSPDPRIDIKEPLERTVSGIIYDSGTDDYAWKAILIILFNHIDLLGNLLSGDSSKANRAKWAVNFIRTYLGKVDEKYAMAGGFIYYMLGNGLMHKSYPGSFNTGDGRMLRFEFSSTQEKQKHLSVTEPDNELKLMFNVTIFYQDLLKAIELYCLDLGGDRALLDRYQQVRRNLTEPEERTQIRNHAYILESDFGFISDQIT